MAIIYHYCSTDSFLKIVQSDALWLSSVRRMNDVSESVFVENLFVEAIAHRKGLHDQDALDFAREILDLNRPEVFSCSFSADPDSTVQWMSYADRGRGIAIGFDPSLLWTNSGNPVDLGIGIDLFSPTRSSVPEDTLALSPVVYCTPERRQIIEKQIDEVLRTGLSREDIALQLTSLSLFLSAICKEPSFSHEREWRLAYAPMMTASNTGGAFSVLGAVTQLQWRASPFGLVPYYSFPNVRHAIKAITLGPANPESKADSFMGLFLHSLNMQGIDIRASSSPYRG